jgi:type IV pilus assembly protein PilO
MKLDLTRSKLVVIGAAAGGFLAALALSYLVLISPQRSEASKLNEQITATELQIGTNRIQGRQTQKPFRIAELFSLTKAMPDEQDMPNVLLELSRIAEGTGVVIDSISPSAPMVGAGFGRLPLVVVFEGSFYDLSDFLYRLRNLVTVRDGTLDARGRLFSVDTVQFTEGSKRFPQLLATVSLSAFVYHAPAAPTPATPGSEPARPQGSSPTAVGVTG